MLLTGILHTPFEVITQIRIGCTELPVCDRPKYLRGNDRCRRNHRCMCIVCSSHINRDSVGFLAAMTIRDPDIECVLHLLSGGKPIGCVS